MIESLIVFAGVVLVISGLLFFAFTAMAVEWCDYWTYRTTICLAQGSTRGECQQELENKIRLLVPRGYFKVENVWKTQRQSNASVKLFFENDFFSFEKTVQSQTRLPLPVR